MSNDLPPELKTVSRYVRDLIDEYKTSSNGKFRWEAIDPGTDKKLEEEANRCKVQKLQIQVLRNQKFEMGQYYMGLCLEYGSQVESIPQVARAEGLEYQISSLIKKLTTKKKKVAFTNGHGEADTNQGFQTLKGDLEQEFELTTVNPSQAEIPDDVDALVVGGPKQAFDEKGHAGDRQVPDGGQGRRLPGRRHGHAGARRHGRPDAADEAEDGPGQRPRPGQAAGALRLQGRPGLRVRPAERPRPDRPRPGPPDAGQPALLRGRRGARAQGLHGGRGPARGGVPLPLQRRTGGPAQGRQAGPGQAVAAGLLVEGELEAHRVLRAQPGHPDRAGQGPGLVRPGVRLPGAAEERLRPGQRPGGLRSQRPGHRVQEAGAAGGDR